MFSSLNNFQQQTFIKKSNQNKELLIVLPDNDNWLETSDDVVTVCSNDNLTHQQRYLARSKRTELLLVRKSQNTEKKVIDLKGQLSLFC